MDELEAEFSETLLCEHSAFFIKYSNHVPAGFAQCGLRSDYVEGTESSPVGYLEGIYVKEAYRRTGIARMLLSLCEDWARSMGCEEFASDTELHNDDGLRFHLNCGFEEAGRIICFLKKL